MTDTRELPGGAAVEDLAYAEAHSTRGRFEFGLAHKAPAEANGAGDLIRLQFGVLLEDVGDGAAGLEAVEDDGDRDTRTRQDRLPVTDPGVGLNVSAVHDEPLLKATGPSYLQPASAWRAIHGPATWPGLPTTDTTGPGAQL